MTDYKINYHHAETKVGHFYMEFDGPLPEGETQKFFGKTSEHTSPIDIGIIRNENKPGEEKNHDELKAAGKVITATQIVNKEKFDAMYNEAKSKSGGIYHATIDNCILFDQQIYETGGGKGHFINLFDKNALKQADTLAAKHSMQYYNTNEMRLVNGLSESDISKRFGVGIDRVVESEKTDLYGRPEGGVKSFVILPEKVNVASKYDISQDTNFKDFTHLTFTVANNLNTIYEAHDRQNVANVQNLDLLRNLPNKWWKDDNAPKGPASNFKNPFDKGSNSGGPSGGGWTPPSGATGGGFSGNGNSGWGSFYQAGNDFMNFGTAKSMSPFMQTALNYKPLYNSLYEDGNPQDKFKTRIPEPKWIYDNNAATKRASKEMEARDSFKRELISCLDNSYCTDSVSTIMARTGAL